LPDLFNQYKFGGRPIIVLQSHVSWPLPLLQFRKGSFRIQLLFEQSKILAEGQTLYSFRHSGAIDVYKRTGSLKKLQLVMGHSNLIVSMTYLRGLEVSDLKVEDMPMISTF